MKRITMVTGHYGSGKTEVSVNLACDLKEKYDKVAILDLDIMNPYFRSRERQKMMENLGIMVQFNSFGYDITEDLPALSAALKTPLENKEYQAIQRRRQSTEPVQKVLRTGRLGTARRHQHQQAGNDGP